ncbi:MAG: PD-(D/E)XK nuclease family protein [Bacteroidales bacterium]
MKILFSPFFSSDSYALSSQQPILFDVAISGETELLSTLELFLGIHIPKADKLKREIEYYKAVKAVICQKTVSAFKQSFTIDPLGTSRCFLKWRDALSLCGWNKKIGFTSERLSLLCEIDQLFDIPGYGDRWQTIIQKLENCHLDNQLKEISVLYPASVLSPHLSTIFELLQKQGVSITYKDYIPELSPGSTNLERIRYAFLSDTTEPIQINQSDNSSFRILEFETDTQANEWIATQPREKWDVLINRNNKAFDDTQYLMGNQSSGSSTSDSHTQVIQLFKLAVGLFEYPLNINNLLAWLNTSENPIPKYARTSLARIVAAKGGLGNEEWISQIEKLTLLTDEEKRLTHSEKNLIEERKKYNKYCIDTFIPEISETINKEDVLDFLAEFKKWGQKRIHATRELSTFEQEIKSAEFAELIAMTDALIQLITNEDIISFETLSIWTAKIYNPISMPYTEPEKGSRFIVHSPAGIATRMKSCLWMDFYDYLNPDSDINFLRNDEKEELINNGCKIQETEQLNRFHYLGQIQPFIYTTESLTVITVEKNRLSPAQKHPLLLRLKATMDADQFKHLIHHAEIDSDKTIEVIEEKKQAPPLYCNFTKTEYVSMPETTSYTGLSQLIQNPVDFVLERILKFNEASISVLNSLETTKGNVAHALIEFFLMRSKDGFETKIDPKEFEKVYFDLLQKHGALLLQRENTIQQMQFKHELSSALEALTDILHQNRLHVVDCEQKFEQKLFDQADSPIIIGYIDLKVQNETGEFLIIDMKWTGFKSNQRRLKQNKALQLAIYKHFSIQNNENVTGVGYFVMPVNRLYTTFDGLQGSNISIITPDNEKELMPECINAYKYRVDEITKAGRIEIAEGMELAEIDYFKDTADKDLYPLESDYDNIDIKKVNPYSPYKLFKNELV